MTRTVRSLRRARPWAKRVHVTVDATTAGTVLALDPFDGAWAKVHADAWAGARWVRVDRLERA